MQAFARRSTVKFAVRDAKTKFGQHRFKFVIAPAGRYAVELPEAEGEGEDEEGEGDEEQGSGGAGELGHRVKLFNLYFYF